jgi:1-acyl-sn-glycerol-3-phosphate acyltransferase
MNVRSVAITAGPILRAVYRVVEFLSFNRITIRRLDDAQLRGPVLYVGLHRNGAMDGVPYLKLAPRAAFMVSAQLHRFPFGRRLFPGIAVARRKDRQRGIVADNDDAVLQSVDHLVAGGELFVMPEGTSTLGPRHLPFKPGAAKIAYEAVRRSVPLTVVPVAVHYECAWEWQSRVEVVVGKPFRLSAADVAGEADAGERIAAALEAVGVNFASEAEQNAAEMLAYAATLGTRVAYAACLKRFEAGVPAELKADAARLRELALDAGAMTHQGVPLTPIGSPLPYLIAWLALAPLMGMFFLVNLPPLAAGYLASRTLPDERNVVAFWRALVGIPAALLWCPATALMLASLVGVPAALAYLFVSAAGIRGFYRFRKLTVAVFNRLRAPQLAVPLLDFHRALLGSLKRD